MNKLSAVVLGLGLFVMPVLASAEESAAVAKAEVAAVEVSNKICPVSHEEVGKEGMAPFKVTHNGKTYNLCCSMCAKDFNKDPEKYVKLIEAEVKTGTN